MNKDKPNFTLEHKNKLLRIHTGNGIGSYAFMSCYERPIQAAWNCVIDHCILAGVKWTNVTMTVRHAKNWLGLAWRDEKRIELNIGPDSELPKRTRYGEFYLWLMPSYYIKDVGEAVLATTTHELWHLFTPYKKYSLGRVPDYMVEFDCDIMAMRAINAWRNVNGTSSESPHDMRLT